MDFHMDLFKEKWPIYSLWLLSGLALFQSIHILVWYWPGSLPDANTSGVWTVLAYDLSNGVFYRPIWGELGFGGTRYMPVFFVLHGLLIILFGDPIYTGLFIILLSALLLGIALYLILRQMEVPWRLALPFACIINSTVSYQMTTLSIRGDFTAAAFNAWGVYLSLKFLKSRSRAALILTAILFVGAFLTKITSIFGLMAVVLYLLSSGMKRHAFRLILMVWIGVGSSLAAIYYLSDGRALISFLECSAGGMDMAYAAGFLFRFFYEIVRDPLFFILFIPAITIFLTRFHSDRQKLPLLLFGITLLFTLFIYASPGTASNHLIDLQAMTIILLATVFSEIEHHKKWISAAIILSCILISLTWLPGTPSIKGFFREHQIPTRASVEELKKDLSGSNAPVLSQNPIFPVLMGQSPFVSDFFNFNILLKRYPSMHRDISRKIEQRYFSTIIFSNWPGIFKRDIRSPEDPHIMEKIDEFKQVYPIEKEIRDLITEYYAVGLVLRPYVFYFPRHRLPEAR